MAQDNKNIPGGSVSTRSRDEIERDINKRRDERNDGNPSVDPHKVRAREHEAAEEHRRSRSSEGGSNHPKSHAPKRPDHDDDRGKSSAELEREVEQERRELTETLDALRDRISPGQMVDQAMSYMRSSASGDFGRNLSHRVQANPLPVVLAGISLGWLMMSSGRSSTDHGSHSGSGFGHRVSETASDLRARASAAAGGAREGTHRLGSGVSEGAGNLSDRASGIASSAREGLHNMSEKASGIASGARDSLHHASDLASSAYGSATGAGHSIADRARDAGARASSLAHDARDSAGRLSSQAQRRWSHMAEEQPLVLGAIGVALGAAVAALLPATRTENRLMGRTSDTLKDQVATAAERQYEHAREVVSDATEEVKRDLDDEGISLDAAARAASSVGHHAGEAAREIADSTTAEVSNTADDVKKDADVRKDADEKHDDKPEDRSKV